MTLKSVFRIVLISEWIFLALNIYLVATISLPEPLTAWIKKEGTSFDYFQFAIIIMIPLEFAASVGLFFFKEWARWLYLVVIIIENLLPSFTGPWVNPALAQTFGNLSILMTGIVIGLSFFTDVIAKKVEPAA
ncbi:MAG: hypothetical protein H6Q18_926 [Bacteroidetes bacterium]|nr:hypothetical protein [Bacteroidota bacterium]